MSASPRELATGLRRLAEKLHELAVAGVSRGNFRVQARRLRREDWAESWKRHFQPLDVGGRLLIKPSWSRRRTRRGQAVVVLDPGLSFGTGQHATTGFCLQQLVALRRPGERQSFLDLGSGSGILAISAAKLGYTPVTALDFDPDAVRIARANCELNGVAATVRLSQGDVRRLPSRARRFDVVCANLTSDLLLEVRTQMFSRLAPGNTLVLAGILRSQFREVRRAYLKMGLKLVRRCTEGEWESGAFRRPA